MPTKFLWPQFVEFASLPEGRVLIRVYDKRFGDDWQFQSVLERQRWLDMPAELERTGQIVGWGGHTPQEFDAYNKTGVRPAATSALPAAVWIVCGGWLQVPAVEAAHQMGLLAIVSDRNPRAPAMQAADVMVIADIYDVPAHLAAADQLKDQYSIQGVFTEGADCEVTVAELAQHLGLPGISPAAALNCKNKARMRSCFQKLGVSPVRFVEVGGNDALLRALAFQKGQGWPIMVKAVDNCGSRGTHRVASIAELQAGLADAMANSTTGTALLEEYLEGPQQSIEVLYGPDGTCLYLNTVDRYFDADAVMELGHVNPTQLEPEQVRRLFELVQEAAQAVGVAFGAFKCDTIWTDDGPRILECTARLSGGLDCQHTTPLATGRDLIGAAMRIACGGWPAPEQVRPTRARYASAWAAFPTPGKVVACPPSGWLDPERAVFMRVQPGDVVETYANCAQRPAFVVVAGDSYAQALERAKIGAGVLASQIVTEPL